MRVHAPAGTSMTGVRGFCNVQTFVNQGAIAALNQNIGFLLAPGPPPPPLPSLPPPPLPPSPPPGTP